jgi:hypothetical protein
MEKITKIRALHCILSTEYCYSNSVNKVGMSLTCSIFEEERNAQILLVGIVNSRYHMGN